MITPFPVEIVWRNNCPQSYSSKTKGQSWPHQHRTFKSEGAHEAVTMKEKDRSQLHNLQTIKWKESHKAVPR